MDSPNLEPKCFVTFRPSSPPCSSNGSARTGGTDDVPRLRLRPPNLDRRYRIINVQYSCRNSGRNMPDGERLRLFFYSRKLFRNETSARWLAINPLVPGRRERKDREWRVSNVRGSGLRNGYPSADIVTACGVKGLANKSKGDRLQLRVTPLWPR